MKSSLTLLFLIVFGGFNTITSQKHATQAAPIDKPVVLIYSEDEEAMVYKHEENFAGPEIMIETLPLVRKASLPLIVHTDLRGTFTFKKHPALLLPDYYTVTIEDKLTGQIFDLRSREVFSVEVKSHISERFVLHMTLAKTNFTAMR
ncbi:hypothetical protein CNR22_14615 [Sphingobacteriaceae bacterium]|nr:hypothetical protein CNR22_14615 [Sphingobacteriaceae bacterium]